MNTSSGKNRVSRIVGLAAVLAAVGVVVTACGGAGKVVSVKDPVSAPSSAATAQPPRAGGPIGPGPNLAPAPSIELAKAKVEAALADIKDAAARVTATAPTPQLQALASKMNRDLAAVVRYRDSAIAAGRRGECARSFAAARAADSTYKAVIRDVGAIRSEVGTIGRVNSSFNKAKITADDSLQTLFNAIAGHPLQADRSSAVDELRALVADGQRDAHDVASQVHQMLRDASAIRAQAKKVVTDAAYAACAEVPSGKN